VASLSVASRQSQRDSAPEMHEWTGEIRSMLDAELRRRARLGRSHVMHDIDGWRLANTVVLILRLSPLSVLMST